VARRRRKRLRWMRVLPDVRCSRRDVEGDVRGEMLKEMFDPFDHNPIMRGKKNS